MKVKINLGNAEISIDGELNEITNILENYWEPLVAHGSIAKEVRPIDSKESPTDSAKSKTRRRPNSARKPTDLQGQEGPTVEPQELANKIKTDKHFQQIKEKILEKKGN